jgi:ABC-type nitrate/sulfonate/bicarbonate transport system permease component
MNLGCRASIYDHIPIGALGLLAMLAVWQAASFFSLMPASILPTPTETLTRALTMPTDVEFRAAAVGTAARWLVGFALGASIGFLIGIVLGSTPLLERAFLPLIDFGRSIPITIAFPIFLLTFGLSNSANIAMAFGATVFLVALNVTVGVGQCNKHRVAFMHTMQARWIDRVRYLYLPEAIDSFILGLRATLSLSLIVVILSEMLVGTRHGLGQLAYNAYLTNSPATLVALIIWVGLAGMAANAALTKFHNGRRL